MTQDQPQVSIVVANWNGEAFLEEGLASLLKSAAESSRPCELIVVDDASTDNSAAWIRKRFPEVRLFENAQNLGFAETCNRGAQEAKGHILLMVNNDVVAPLDFVQRVTDAFFLSSEAQKSTPLFAVGARTMDWQGQQANHLCMTAAWRRGGIGKVWSDPQHPTLCCYVQAGAAAYDRQLFLELGGFDALYHPGYWEDYDLSYRACKAGWRVLYDPRAQARHRGEGSMSKRYGKQGVRRLDERNRYWFIWSNLHDRGLLLRHFLTIPWVCVREIICEKNATALIGFFSALKGFSGVLSARRRRIKQDPAPKCHDRQLMRIGQHAQDDRGLWHG